MTRTRTFLLALAAASALAASGPAHAELLLDEWEQVGEVVVFKDHDPKSGRCYYLPEARIGRRADGVPNLTFLKYTKASGEEHFNGGVLRFTIGLGLDGSALARLQRQRPACRSIGPVPFKAGRFIVVSAALGAGGVFTRNIVGEGAAPLVSNHEAAVSIAVTPEGATFLERALSETNHSVDVVFDMTYSGLTAAYEASVKVDWTKVRQFTESDRVRRLVRRRVKRLGIWKWVWFVRDGHNREQELRDYMASSGLIEVVRIGRDDQLDDLLEMLTNQIMSVISDVELDLPDEGEAEAADDDGDGEDREPPVGTRVSVKTVRREGKVEMSLRGRQREDRDTGPMAADLGEPLRRHSSDQRVYRLIDLDDPDFHAQTVSVTLDIEGFDSFGDYINYATVLFRKRYREAGRRDHNGDVSFNRRSFGDSSNVLTWTFPRLGEPGSAWLGYEYKETWSFAGGVKHETDWRSAESPYLALAPPFKLRTIDLALDPEQAAAREVQFVSVAIKNRVGGHERVREVRLRPEDGPWSQYRYYHDENDLDLSFRITWHLRGSRVTSDWRSTTDSFIDINYYG